MFTLFKRTRQIVSLAALAATLVTASVANAQTEEEVLAAVQNTVGDRAEVRDIKPSPMEGVYEVTVGTRTMYASMAGKHLMLGDVFDTERQVSLAQEIKTQKIITAVEGMPEAEMIVFGDDDAKRTITVFTDVDCVYCQRLHAEVPKLVEGGLKVRYLWFPRAGVESESYEKAVSVWCADDQLKAMDNAKLKNKFKDRSCDPNPVEAQFQVGQQVGVQGTPTIIVDDGNLIGGYVPADALLKSLGLLTEG